jgi:hypothetical protein
MIAIMYGLAEVLAEEGARVRFELEAVAATLRGKSPLGVEGAAALKVAV